LRRAPHGRPRLFVVQSRGRAVVVGEHVSEYGEQLGRGGRVASHGVGREARRGDERGELDGREPDVDDVRANGDEAHT
jgi:hypothetical protein